MRGYQHFPVTKVPWSPDSNCCSTDNRAGYNEYPLWLLHNEHSLLQGIRLNLLLRFGQYRLLRFQFASVCYAGIHRSKEREFGYIRTLSQSSCLPWFLRFCRQAQFYSNGLSAAAFRPEIRPKAMHSPMLPPPSYKKL